MFRSLIVLIGLIFTSQKILFQLLFLDCKLFVDFTSHFTANIVSIHMRTIDMNVCSASCNVSII